MKTESEIVEGIDEDEIRLAFESILASDAFQKAHRMRRLFRYLMGQVLAVDKGTISEYTIGIEVFDRNPEDYISEDPAIRVQIGRLRHRLAAYYTDHAVSGDVEISIPVGTYTPSFRRVVRPERRKPVQGGFIMVQPIKYIAERIEGQVFASGLYEELLNQLFSSFGDIFMWAEPPFSQPGKRVGTTGDEHYAAPHRLIEGSLRIDAERIRTSIRLIDYSLSRITWARHFDRSVQFGIREQEELAASICHALREVVSV
ncbi:hypothetical protein [Pinirhizobacter soli]|uniref:hypothetical protein n=1 Tax=Pinirhizobacter soli TaxID=2786953 RepID=UPI00202A3969